MATSSRSERIELRAQPERARRIRQAARIRGQSLSRFMLEAAGEAAEKVIASTATTAVPGPFFRRFVGSVGKAPEGERRAGETGSFEAPCDAALGEHRLVQKISDVAAALAAR